MAKSRKFGLARALIVEFLGKYRGTMVALSVMGILMAIGDASIPFIVGGFLDSVINASATYSLFGLTAPLWMWFIGVFAVVQFAASLLGWAYEMTSRQVGTMIFADVNIRASSRLMRMPMSFHSDQNTGSVWDKIMRSGNATSEMIEKVILRISPQILSVLVGVVVALNINVTLTLIVLSGIALYVLVLTNVVPPLVKIQKISNRLWNKAFNNAFKTFANASTIKLFTAEEYEDRRVFAGYHKGVVPQWNKVEKAWSDIAFYQRVVVVLTQIAVFATSVYFISKGELSIGNLVAFNGYTAMVFGPFMMLGYTWEVIQNGLVSIERAEKLLGVEPEVYAPDGGVDLKTVEGDIDFRGVSFVYRKKDKSVFRDLTFQVKRGEIVAFVGESGVGKTTIASLIGGFYLPTRGKILIDGVDMKKINLKSLREAIAVVPQEVVLFNDTIENNIRYGSFKASQADVRKAAREAHAEDFILKFPLKYKQLVGERGVKLSVGQKQRVAIARAILRDPKILILDEPTSALDVQTERQITDSLEKLMEGRTTIIIAHRLSTVRKADKILVFDKGRLVEQGTHESLLKQKEGLYKSLYKLHIGLQ
ncbi:MAG: ABC transporter ATP-binding protein/permease [Candidatus Colwellbacteria bacterium]|nr:ABC transporter ATP-binding protein/permease [Candidatus Colwellbacteria bacterium]